MVPSIVALAPEGSALSTSLNDVSHVIQLAIAPVFLLTSIGAILSLLAYRLARIVDRMRVLTERMAVLDLAESMRAAAQEEASSLRVRRKLVNQAMMFGTMAAIFVALLIISAFVGALTSARVPVLLAVLFMLALVAFVGALVSFLREVLLAGRSVETALPFTDKVIGESDSP